MPQYRTGRKLIYQFGNASDDYLIFPGGDLSWNFQPSPKTIQINVSNNNGINRINGAEPDKINSYMMTLSFTYNTEDNHKWDFNYLNKVSHQGVKPVFFYERTYDNDIIWYYTFGVFSLFPNQYQASYDGIGRDNFSVNMGIQLLPFFYRCDNNLGYYNRGTGDSAIYGTAIYGTDIYGEATTQALVSTLTPAEKTYMFDLCDLAPESDTDTLFSNYGKRRTLPLSYLDRFILRNDTATVGTYLLDETLTTDTFSDVATSTILKDTVYDNRIYRLIISPLDDGQSLSIQNLDNSTGINIRWTGTPNANDIIYNSYKDKFYDSVTGSEISNTSIAYDILDNDILYFSALLKQPEVQPISPPETENIRIQRSAGSNITIQIDALPTFN